MRRLVLGTAGHVDHGKTALVAALSGIQCDRLIEEKQRGLTIDLGFAHLTLDDIALGVVDVPGHERFVKNMLAGAVGIDVALLVIAADDGVMPQTREHLTILQLLGIQCGVIAITKIDRVESDWVALIESEIAEVVQGTFLEQAPRVPTALPPGGQARGIDALKHAIYVQCQQLTAKGSATEASTTFPFRMPIDRSFTLAGQGAIVTGTVWAGELGVGETVEWLPSGKQLQIRALHSHGQNVTRVECGQRSALNISGAHYTQLRRGQLLATPGYLKPSRWLTVELEVVSDSSRFIKHRDQQRVHLATQEVMATVYLPDAATPLMPGHRMLAQMHTADDVVAVTGQPFILRHPSPPETIGGGHVLQPVAKRIIGQPPDHWQRCVGLASSNPLQRAETAIYFYFGQRWRALDLCRDANIAVNEVDKVIHSLASANLLVSVNALPAAWWVHRDVVNLLASGLLKTAAVLHARAPHLSTVSTFQLRNVWSSRYPDALISYALDSLRAEGRLQGDQDRTALTTHIPQRDRRTADLFRELEHQLRTAGCCALSLARVAHNTAAHTLQPGDLLAQLIEDGKVVRIATDLYMHSQAIEEVRSVLRAHLHIHHAMTLSQIGAALKATRKTVVPLCEYLDRIGFTKRDGNLRKLNTLSVASAPYARQRINVCADGT